jgi:hypothetical protein
VHGGQTRFSWPDCWVPASRRPLLSFHNICGFVLELLPKMRSSLHADTVNDCVSLEGRNKLPVSGFCRLHSRFNLGLPIRATAPILCTQVAHKQHSDWLDSTIREVMLASLPLQAELGVVLALDLVLGLVLDLVLDLPAWFLVDESNAHRSSRRSGFQDQLPIIQQYLPHGGECGSRTR